MKKDIKNTIFISLLIIAIFLISFGIMHLVKIFAYSNLSDRALLGDSFGVINSLFSGLALFAVVISIYIQADTMKLQQDDLRLNREELEMNRAELKKSADAQVETQKILSKQIELMTLQTLGDLKSSRTNIKLAALDGFSSTFDKRSDKIKRDKYIEIRDEAREDLDPLIEQIETALKQFNIK